MNPINVALDWTPNINHIGLVVAKELGFYAAEGIQAELLNPLEDQYFLTPGKKLELGLADFSLAPFETVISLNNKKNQVDAIAVYAILQEDLSCVVSLRSSDLTQMKQLDGKIYASYKARYEDHIIQEMVKKDGGTGEIILSYPEKLGIWNTLLTGKADATWIFDNWEGVEASSKNIMLNKFYLADYGIPYGYSPVIFTKKQKMDQNPELHSRFVRATQRGYQFAVENPEKAVSLLYPYLTPYDQQSVDLPQALKLSSPHFTEGGQYGYMKTERVQAFLEWLVEKNLEQPAILQQELFTNALLNGDK
jgi:ABC-type nitrate/sulfonate/bicarbonate transport system substrate-binding protein